MAISKVSSQAATTVIPIGGSGTYTLSAPLDPGLYRITTDTSQTFTATQLKFLTNEGYAFGAEVRGGQGYVAIPSTVNSVVLSSGTFPLLLGFEKFPSYALAPAPTTSAASVSWNATLVGDPNFDLGFTADAAATDVGIYWSDGSFTSLGTTTSPKTGIVAKPTAAVGSPTTFLVVQTDANGVYGYGTEVTSEYPYIVFTTSGTYTPPAGSTSADVLVVAGGGGGGGVAVGVQYGTAAPGGGAAATYSTGVATLAPVTVTIGAAGNGGNGGSGAAGGTSSFGALTASGGAGGVAASNNSGPTGATSGSGNAGGSGATKASGGGGGSTGVGENATVNNGGDGGAGTTAFNITVGGGGGGGGLSSAGVGVDGGGSGTTNGNGSNAPLFRGGGGGASCKANDSSNSFVRAGGNGGAGVVVVMPN